MSACGPPGHWSLCVFPFLDPLVAVLDPGFIPSMALQVRDPSSVSLTEAFFFIFLSRIWSGVFPQPL